MLTYVDVFLLICVIVIIIVDIVKLYVTHNNIEITYHMNNIVFCNCSINIFWIKFRIKKRVTLINYMTLINRQVKRLIFNILDVTYVYVKKMVNVSQISPT